MARIWEREEAGMCVARGSGGKGAEAKCDRPGRKRATLWTINTPTGAQTSQDMVEICN